MRTSSFNAQTAFPDIGTQVNSVTIRPMLSRILAQRSRGNRAADLLIMSQEHYWAYDAATVAIQRIVNESTLGKNEVDDLANQLFGAGVKQLNKMQASQLIEDLLVKAGKPATRQTRWQQRPTTTQAA